MRGRAGPLVAWVLGLAAATALLHAVGSGPLAPPPLEPAGWMAWAQARDPLVATVAVLRMVALALSWYLVGTTAIGIVARLVCAARLVRVADALSVPGLRRLLQGALGVSLATAMVTATPPGASAQQLNPPIGISVTQAGEEASGAQAEVVQVDVGRDDAGDSSAPSSPQEMRPLPLELLQEIGTEPIDHTVGRGATVDAPAAGDLASGAEHASGADDHVVVSGESLWTIARDVLASRSEEAPTDGEVAGYWHRVIEANRDRLDDPDNPDLIFPGQSLTLPALGDPST